VCTQLLQQRYLYFFFPSFHFYLVQEHIASDCTLNPDIKGMSSALSTDVPTEVKFVLSDNLKSEIQSAINYHKKQVDGLEVSFGQNFEVNRNWMASHNLGADGFLQLSLQISHRLLHGKKLLSAQKLLILRLPLRYL
jgi:hypothetical protein